VRVCVYGREKEGGGAGGDSFVDRVGDHMYDGNEHADRLQKDDGREEEKRPRSDDATAQRPPTQSGHSPVVQRTDSDMER
jgi:hypothetical protein